MSARSFLSGMLERNGPAPTTSVQVSRLRLFAQGGGQLANCQAVAKCQHLACIDHETETLQSVMPFALRDGFHPLIANKTDDIIGETWVRKLRMCHVIPFRADDMRSTCPEAGAKFVQQCDHMGADCPTCGNAVPRRAQGFACLQAMPYARRCKSTFPWAYACSCQFPRDAASSHRAAALLRALSCGR